VNAARSFSGVPAALLLLLSACLCGASTVYAADAATSAATSAPNDARRTAPNTPAVARQKPRVRAATAVNRATAKPRSAPDQATLALDMKRAARQATRAQTQPLYVFPSTDITPNVRQNLYGPPSAPIVEMGDRPARSAGLCGDGKYRRFAELDSRTVAALLPEFNGVRPRTICARRGVVIADYSFK
jgi:hypothetical protein